jgi:hypothetical protein
MSKTKPAVDDDGIPLLGKDPDPGAEVERRIKVGWALVGIFFTLGIFTYLVDKLGLDILPKDPTKVDYSRLFAFCVACLNILVWMWFPVDDLMVLRRWVRTKRIVFPAGPSELYAILLEMILLLSIIIGAIVSPFWFGLAGTGVFAWNTIGFSWIRRHVNRAVREARDVYSEQKPPRRQILLRAVDQIEMHWCCEKGWSSDRQQIRHVTLTFAFSVVTALAVLGEVQRSDNLKVLAYLLGAMILIFAEVWIARWRSARDLALRQIREELRSLNAP